MELNCFLAFMMEDKKQPTQNTKNKAHKPRLMIFHQQPNSIILMVF